MLRLWPLMLVVAMGCQAGQLTTLVTDRSASDGGVPSDGGTLDSSPLDSSVGATDSGLIEDTGQATDPGTDAATDAGTDVGPLCTPSCGAATCGDDGCGGSCGVCGDRAVCSAGQCQIEGCPPTGPFGAGVGQTATNITLYDCDGNPVELHSLCGRRVSHLYGFAEWCSSCRTFVRDQMAAQHNNYAAMGDLTTWLVVTAVTSGSLDATSCRRIRDSYGIDTPGITVLYDPTGLTNSVLNMFANANDLVMSRYNKIVINARYSAHIGLPQAFANTTP